MRILFLTDNFPPEVNAPATRTYEHCKEWVKQGADVTVITCYPNFPQGKVYDGYQNKRISRENVDGIKVIRVWTYITANEGFIKRTLDYISFSFSAFFAGLFQKTDLIIATSPQFFTALAGRTLSFWKRKPWIMEVRDLWPESIKTVGAMKDNIFIRYFEKEELWCYRSASKVITVTDAFKTNLIRKGVTPEKIHVVKNGANLDLFKPAQKDEQLLNELGLQGKTILGYIGTHGMAHKLDFLADCARQLENTNYHFLFLGNGAEKQKLVDKVKQEQIKNITLLDSVPKNKVVSYLSIIDIALINLRKSDLFKTVIPSKIFENAAMQIPILIGVDGEARSIVEQYEAGLFYEPENSNDFLDKLETIGTPEQYRKCQQGGRKLAQAFDRKKLADSLLQIVRNNINSNPK
ncbi:glycosyltransferase family 4 protein [Maribellus sp. CM-23]|uniref:glycosyltransferase family 4 protein n=1 Tax=Maribellus sp. CM-23 TaxID=2781026 RepID=UPI001F46BF8C|nr:glycosyltransferase family 4 protein [Maribellus sp. CM-23]MCE4566481.1 glycosyltransferase family 4 protein [Maribellus sp. CM-23]